jgi:hypothetical protein
MKKLILSVAFISFLFSCEKDNDSLVINSYIKAGDSTSQAVVYINGPDTVFQSECSKQYFSSCGTALIYNLDLNQDDINDYEIELFLMTGIGHDAEPGFLIAAVTIAPLNIHNKVSINEGLYSSVKIHSASDSICKNLTWSEDTLLHNLVSLNVSGYTNEIPSYSYDINSWAGKMDKYIGLQMIEPSDTIYGWIRLDVYDVYKIAIKDFAYIKVE